MRVRASPAPLKGPSKADTGYKVATYYKDRNGTGTISPIVMQVQILTAPLKLNSALTVPLFYDVENRKTSIKNSSDATGEGQKPAVSVTDGSET